MPQCAAKTAALTVCSALRTGVFHVFDMCWSECRPPSPHRGMWALPKAVLTVGVAPAALRKPASSYAVRRRRSLCGEA